MSRVDVFAHIALVAVLGVLLFVLGLAADVPGWLLWAGVCVGADMISTRITTYRNGTQEYTAFTIAAVGALMYLPATEALSTLMVGSVAAVAMSLRTAWYKKAFNAFAYLMSSVAMWTVYEWGNMLLGGVPWPSLSAAASAVAGVMAFELVNGSLFALLGMGMGISWRDVLRGWGGSVLYPMMSVLAALGLGSLYELGFVWFVLPLLAVLVLLRPEYDLRRWRGHDSVVKAS